MQHKRDMKQENTAESLTAIRLLIWMAQVRILPASQRQWIAPMT